MKDKRDLDRNKEKTEPGVDEQMLGAGEKPRGGGELAGVKASGALKVRFNGEGWSRQWGRVCVQKRRGLL